VVFKIVSKIEYRTRHCLEQARALSCAISNYIARISEKPIVDQRVHHIRFEVIMAVTMKNAIIWDVPLCGSC
jgi:hypothetical protein